MPAVGSWGHILENWMPKRDGQGIYSMSDNLRNSLGTSLPLVSCPILLTRESSANKIRSWDLATAEIIHCDFHCCSFVHLCLSSVSTTEESADSALPGRCGLGRCCWNVLRVLRAAVSNSCRPKNTPSCLRPGLFCYSFREGLEFHLIRCVQLQLFDSTYMQMRP